MKRIGLLVIVALLGGAVGACADPGPGGPRSPSTADPIVTSKGSGPVLWGTVSGSVRDGSGQPVRGVLIVPTGADSSVTGVPEIAVTTDRDGHYDWRLQPGRYTLVAQLDGRFSTPVPVTVEAGAQTAADLVLPA